MDQNHINALKADTENVVEKVNGVLNSNGTDKNGYPANQAVSAGSGTPRTFDPAAGYAPPVPPKDAPAAIAEEIKNTGEQLSHSSLPKALNQATNAIQQQAPISQAPVSSLPAAPKHESRTDLIQADQSQASRSSSASTANVQPTSAPTSRGSVPAAKTTPVSRSSSIPAVITNPLKKIASKTASEKSHSSIKDAKSSSASKEAPRSSISKEALPEVGSISKEVPPTSEKHPKVSIRDNTTFSWKNVGSWDYSSPTDKEGALNTSKVIEAYVKDHFYGDWYWNCSLIIGTCFFSWLGAKWGGGFLSLIVVLLFTNSIYRSEFRRFNRDIRDDLARVNAINRLDNEAETMEWLNSFLDKFWVIYMPAMSEMVLTIANGILKDLAPGFGIDKLSLDEFTLGSKAPRINSVRSYPKKAEDHIEMDWDFSFTPNDTDGMTKAEIKKKIDPKVALGVTIGKAFISKSFPVLVEDMSMTGRLKIRLKLSQNFPHVKIVSVQFLEAPTIEYGFKPMGGDTLGLDIMSFIPGLRTVVNGVIHSILRPMFYAPNSFDVDVEEMLAAQSNDSIGVVAVTVLRLQKLKKGNPTKPNSINPYVQLKISNNASINEKTTVKKLINDPVYNETKYLLVNQLDGNHLNFNVFHLVEDKADDQLIGSVDFQLADLLQEEAHNNVIKTLTESGKAVGKIEFNLKYFPVRAPLVLEDGTKEPILDAEVGILKLNLHEARDLDISSSVLGILNPYAEIYVNDELVKKCRRLRRTNEPSWGQSLESLITQQSETTVQVLIKDSVDDTIVAKLNSNLQDLVFETSRGQEWIETDPVTEGGPRPRVRITANWKAIKIDDTSIVKTHENAPIGGLRLHLRSAKSLKNLEAVGLVDPYVRVLLNGKLRAKTATFENTLDPLFNTAYFLPVANEHQHYLLQIMDEEPEGKDRSLGTAAVHIGDFLKRDQNGYFLPHDGADTILEQPVIFNGQPTGTIYYSVSFIPAIPVYSLSQIKNKEAYLEEVKEKEAAAIAKQAADEKLFKEKPNEYEWIEVEEEEVVEPKKVQMGLDSSIKYRSGIVSVHLLGGSFEKSDVYVHTLFDEQAYSSGVSPKSEGNRLSVPSSGDGFVRDLPLSKLIIRIAKKVEVDFESDIIAEQIFDTLDILKKSYSKPITLRIQDRNQVKLQLEFIPSDVQLNPLDTVLDIGKVKLEVIGADNLKSVDTNGKSDPLCVVKLDGKEILKTDKKRKTLSPVWNESVDFSLLSRSRQSIVLEVYDWDYTHDDELIGKTVVNLSSLEPSKTQEFSSELDTQGRINLRATFKPEYIRPKLAAKSALPMDLNFDAPMNVVGGAADVAGNVAGGVVGGAGAVAGGVVGGVGGIASEGIARGGSFLKGFGRSKKKHSSNGDETSTIADDSFASHDKNFSDIESEAAHDNASRHSPMSPSKKGREVVNKSAELQSLRSGAAPVSNSLQHSQVDGIARPPIPGHLRTPSAASDAASIASSFAPGAIPGRLTIVSASNLNTKDPVEVKVVLKQPTKQKDLFKTRNTKGDKSANTFKWNESVPFKSVTEGELIFDIREHHTFGKNVSLGQATVKLSDVIGRPDNLELNVGSGQLVVNVRYN